MTPGACLAHARSRCELASALWEAGQLARAAEAWTSALRLLDALGPDAQARADELRIGATLGVAQAQAARGRLEPALAGFERAIALLRARRHGLPEAEQRAAIAHVLLEKARALAHRDPGRAASAIDGALLALDGLATPNARALRLAAARDQLARSLARHCRDAGPTANERCAEGTDASPPEAPTCVAAAPGAGASPAAPTPAAGSRAGCQLARQPDPATREGPAP